LARWDSIRAAGSLLGFDLAGVDPLVDRLRCDAVARGELGDGQVPIAFADCQTLLPEVGELARTTAICLLGLVTRGDLAEAGHDGSEQPARVLVLVLASWWMPSAWYAISIEWSKNLS
jgi:hypothetical protein